MHSHWNLQLHFYPTFFSLFPSASPLSLSLLCPQLPLRTYNCLEDQELREGIKEYSSWPTIPQVYVKGEFVGGCDIMLSSESWVWGFSILYVSLSCLFRKGDSLFERSISQYPQSLVPLIFAKHTSSKPNQRRWDPKVFDVTDFFFFWSLLSKSVHQSGELEQILDKAGILEPLPPSTPTSS